ncbi:MAG TPA: biotin-independent malonate decarboxylase subunit gamma [Steroidobacteraceae bacterium]|jgi:malonate decarboxylase gamma subunit|nr:biotin-independent malonate decarboxylase subunit gamma [Steroidobacteraceae bacterium]
MSLDELLRALFGHSFTVDERADGVLLGEARLAPAQALTLIGVVNAMPLGVEGALTLAHRILAAVRSGQRQPILVLIDSGSQRMSRRDELLGLNEYLAHLAKCLMLADRCGFPTISLLYGGGAAGAFVATALATRALVALPGANPAVMDLPSISRVTKLALQVLQRIGASTPVFAPGLTNMQLTGAITEVWDPHADLPGELSALLRRMSELPEDARDRAGEQYGGRKLSARVAEAVRQQAGRRD